MSVNRCPACLRPIEGLTVYLRLPERWLALHPQCGLRLAVTLLDSIGTLKEAA